MTAFLLAHLSDPHLGPLPSPKLRELLGKRVIGFINWQRSRGLTLRPEILTTLLDDLKAQGPHHVALTGDLVNIALAAEIPAASAWLQALGPPDWVSLVPGNHDAYVRGAMRWADTAWSPYMTGDAGMPPPHPPRFPYVRIRGPVAVVGVSSAIATGFFMASGKVGREQRARLGDVLRRLGAERLFRAVLIHHPPIEGATSWHKRLEDAPAVAAVLAEAGAELVLHGHTHLPTVHWIEAATPIPVVGVPSASAAPGDRKPPGAYNLFCIRGCAPAWHVELVTRGYGTEGEPFGERRRLALTRSVVPVTVPP